MDLDIDGEGATYAKECMVFVTKFKILATFEHILNKLEKLLVKIAMSRPIT